MRHCSMYRPMREIVRALAQAFRVRRSWPKRRPLEQHWHFVAVWRAEPVGVWKECAVPIEQRRKSTPRGKAVDENLEARA